MSKKKVALIVAVTLVVGLLLGGAAGAGIGYSTYATTPNGDSWSESYAKLQDKYNALDSEHKEYVEKMSQYEGLSDEEAQAREIAAKKTIEDQKQKEKEAAEAAKKEKEEKEKKGYDSGITYEQLARTPDDYKGEKVKFSGEVIQVMEDDGTCAVRVAVNENYDDVLFGVYDSSIVSSRILEDDKITIYGTSTGLYSYETVMGDTLTIPSVEIEKIER